MKPYFFLLSAELAWPNDSFELPYNFLERLDHIKKVKSILFWNFLKLFLFFWNSGYYYSKVLIIVRVLMKEIR